MGNDPEFSCEFGDERNFISVRIGNVDDSDHVCDDLRFSDRHTILAQPCGGVLQIVDAESHGRPPGPDRIGDDL